MGNPSGNHNHISSTLQSLKRELYWGGETIKSMQNKKQVKSWCQIPISTTPHHPFSVLSGCRIGYSTCLHHQWYCKLWYSLGKQNSDFPIKKSPGSYILSQMKLSISNWHPRTYTRQRSQIQFSKIYCEKSLGGRMSSEDMFSTKIFTQMLSVVSNWITLLPSTYTYLHSYRSSLAWEKTINRDAKCSMKNPNLSTGFVRLCILCQRKVAAQCRGRCCRQHLLGGFPVSATIQPFHVCKCLAQEQFLSAFSVVTPIPLAHFSPLFCRAATELPSSPHSGLYQSSHTLLPNLLNFTLW